MLKPIFPFELGLGQMGLVDIRDMLKNISIPGFLGSRYQHGMWIRVFPQVSNIFWLRYFLWGIFLGEMASSQGGD